MSARVRQSSAAETPSPLASAVNCAISSGCRRAPVLAMAPAMASRAVS